MNGLQEYTNEAVELLQKIVSIPSYSFGERDVADFLHEYLLEKQKRVWTAKSMAEPPFTVKRIANNLILYSPEKTKDVSLNTVLFTAHIDTVKESDSYTVNPFGGEIAEGRLYGLGSNDDGGCVVCSIAAFLHYIDERERGNAPAKNGGKFQRINPVVVLGAEEERSGVNGMQLIVKELEKMDIHPCYAIVGEPTGLKAAVAERGLLVIDGTAHGVSGHAARNEGVNALYIAIDDINKMRSYEFAKKSPLMGDVKLTVTQIKSGSAHNVIPDKCEFTVDIRTTEQYSNSEITELLQKEVKSELKARNLNNKSSATKENSLLFKILEKGSIESFISPTTSDWMRIPYQAIKIGPGESSRSHKADEYITIKEIEAGIECYIKIIDLLEEILEDENGNTME